MTGTISITFVHKTAAEAWAFVDAVEKFAENVTTTVKLQSIDKNVDANGERE